MTNPARTLLSDIRKLAPEITSRIPEIEAGGRIPIDLVEALKSIGVFRLFVPRRHALARTLKDDALTAQAIQAAIWIAAACIRVADPVAAA
jgi:hypothetical protein